MPIRTHFSRYCSGDNLKLDARCHFSIFNFFSLSAK